MSLGADPRDGKTPGTELPKWKMDLCSCMF